MKKLIAIVLVLVVLLSVSAMAEVIDTLEDTEIEATDAAAFEAEAFEEIFGEAEFEAEVEITADVNENVTLTAKVTANGAYTLTWEVNDGNGWTATENHEANLTCSIEDAMNNSFRAVVTEA